jgi:peptide deformylase
MTKVRLVGDPILRTKTTPISQVDDSVTALVKEMIETMNASEGVGLAANQIGSNKRIFIMNTRGSIETFVNPEVLWQQDDVIFEEACLSIPGVTAKTHRFNRLKVKYYKLEDINTPIEEILEGVPAIAIQHEMDHLDGKLYVDAFGPVKKGIILDKHKKYLKDLNRQDIQ